MSDQNGLPDRFRALQQKFIARCGSELPILIEVQGRVVIDPETLGDVGRMAHSLAGAGGTFGFADVSAAAQRLEDAIVTGGASDNASMREALHQLIDALKNLPSA